MAYSSLSDIQAEFKNLTFGPTTTPKDTVVSGFIDQADAEINARIGLRYAVPINTASCPVAAVTLKRLSTWLVTARVKEILKVKTGDAASSQDSRGGDLGKMARDQLDQISKGQYLLSDAPLANTTEGMQSFGYSNGETLFFDKDSDQW
jgi:hypothetical protein